MTNNNKKILLQLFLTFFKIGAFTFGGGYAMISLLDSECVEKKQWITSDELMDVTVIAESTPGPIAINCATYTGYRKSGMAGAIVSTLGMILPSFIVIFIISKIFEDLLSYQIINNIFRGIRVAVTILIIQAAMKMIKKMMKKTENKILPITIISAFFIIVLVFDTLEVHISTFYLIIVSGIMGYIIYGIKDREKLRK